MAGTAKKTTSRKKQPKKLPEGLRLTADRIVVSMPSDGERKTKGGLLIPATAGPTPKRCVWADVILVGPAATTVKTGDRVLFLPQVGLEVDIEGDEYLLLRERDVQAVTPAQSADGDHAPGQYL